VSGSVAEMDNSDPTFHHILSKKQQRVWLLMFVLCCLQVTHGYNLLEDYLFDITDVQRWIYIVVSGWGFGQWFSSIMKMNNIWIKVSVTFLCDFLYFLPFLLTNTRHIHTLLGAYFIFSKACHITVLRHPTRRSIWC